MWNAVYCRELVSLAKQKRLQEIPPVGLLRPELLSRLSACSRIVLLGPSGVGKTALMMAYAQSLAEAASAQNSPRLYELSFARMRRILKPDQAMRRLLRWQHLEQPSPIRTRIYVPDLRQGMPPDWIPFILELMSGSFETILELDGPTWSGLEPLCREHRIPTEAIYIPEKSTFRSSTLINAWIKTQPDIAHISPELVAFCQLLSERFGLEAGVPGGGYRLFRRCMLPHDVAEGPPSLQWMVERVSRLYGLPEPLTVMPILESILPRMSSALTVPAITGQPQVRRALNGLFRRMQLRRDGTDSPLGSLLLSGAVGYGRRRLVRSLARTLFGDETRVLQWGEPLRPFHVLVIPSIEGLALSQRQLLTSILYGSRTPETLTAAPALDADARRIYRSIFMVCLHNGVSADYLPYSVGDVDAGTYERLDQASLDKLVEEFKSIFIQGFDAVSFFHPTPRDDLRMISRELVQSSLERIFPRPKGIEVSESVYDWLAVYGVDPFTGIQLFERFAERSIMDAWTRTLGPEPSRTVSIRLTVQEQRLEFKILTQPEGESQVLSMARVSNPEGKPVALQSLSPRTTDGRGIDVGGLPGQPTVSPLVLQAERLVKSAVRRLKPVEAQEAERLRVLTRLREPSVWQDRAEVRRLYSSFQLLERQQLASNRLQESMKQLREQLSLRQERGESEGALDMAVAELSTAIRLWDERLASEGLSQAWVVMSCLDVQVAGCQWLVELLNMQKLWCVRRGLRAEVVAVELSREGPTRLALRVRGTGATRILGMEEGLHRLHRPSGDGLTVRIQCVPLDEVPTPAPAGRVPQPLPPRSAPLPVTLDGTGEQEQNADGSQKSYRMRLELPTRRQMMDFVGISASVLLRLVTDLERAWAEADETPEVARLYGSPKAGAWDPRTGAMMPRLKEVLSGQLDPLLEQWMLSGG